MGGSLAEAMNGSKNQEQIDKEIKASSHELSETTQRQDSGFTGSSKRLQQKFQMKRQSNFHSKDLEDLKRIMLELDSDN